MSGDLKPDEKPDEAEDPVISFIKKFQIQVKGENKDAGFQTEEDVEDKKTESGREEDKKP